MLFLTFFTLSQPYFLTFLLILTYFLTSEIQILSTHIIIFLLNLTLMLNFMFFLTFLLSRSLTFSLSHSPADLLSHFLACFSILSQLRNTYFINACFHFLTNSHLTPYFYQYSLFLVLLCLCFITFFLILKYFLTHISLTNSLIFFVFVFNALSHSLTLCP